MENQNRIARKLAFLRTLYTNNGDYNLIYQDHVNHRCWPRALKFTECNEQQLIEANLRTKISNEIILDIDTKAIKDYNAVSMQDCCDKILDLLDKEKYKYKAEFTGSTGYHVKLIFDELKQYDINTRNKIRKFLIKKYKLDEHASTEIGWIACSDAPHFKTGLYKEIYRETIGENHFNADVLNFIKNINNSNNEVVVTNQVDSDWLNEPYLKFALENKIEDGGRNDILFKNLAVVISRSGIKEEERNKLIEVIVNNCPGKNVGEFNGWIQKALNGELKDFNKAELIQWSEKYNHPVLYNKVDDEGLLNLLSTKELFSIIWNKRISKQPIWKELCFYNLVGTILDEREDDLRVNVIFSSYTTTGKDEGINLLKKILDEIGLKTAKPSLITDRTLIGSVNAEAREFNLKHNLDNNNKVVIKGSNTFELKDEIEYGDLKECNWMAFGEAEVVFKPSVWNRNIQMILRQAMDSERYIEKGVGGRKIKFYTNTSFVLVTYPLNDVIIQLLTNGLFQRVLYYNKEINKELGDAIEEHNIKTFFKYGKVKLLDDDYYKELIERLKLIKTWYDREKDKIEYKEGLDLYVTKLISSLKMEYALLEEEDKFILDAIVRRGLKNLYKVAKLNAIVNMRYVMSEEDIDVSFLILKECITSTKMMIMKNTNAVKLFKAISYLFKNTPEVETMELIEIVKRKVGVGGNKASILINQLIKDGKLFVKKDINNKKMLYLADSE